MEVPLFCRARRPCPKYPQVKPKTPLQPLKVPRSAHLASGTIVLWARYSALYLPARFCKLSPSCCWVSDQQRISIQASFAASLSNDTRVNSSYIHPGYDSLTGQLRPVCLYAVSRYLSATSRTVSQHKLYPIPPSSLPALGRQSAKSAHPSFNGTKRGRLQLCSPRVPGCHIHHPSTYGTRASLPTIPS